MLKQVTKTTCVQYLLLQDPLTQAPWPLLPALAPWNTTAAKAYPKTIEKKFLTSA